MQRYVTAVWYRCGRSAICLNKSKYTECPTLMAIKHISEMKADFDLFSVLLSMITLPVFFLPGQGHPLSRIEEDGNSFRVGWFTFGSPIVFVPFGTGSFLTLGYEEGGPFPGPLVLQIWSTPLDVFLWEFVKDIVYCERAQNANELPDRIVRAAVKCLPAPGVILNIILMCVMPLTVPILRPTEHIRNFTRFSVWKCFGFSNTSYGWRCTFYCHLRPDIQSAVWCFMTSLLV